jgi:hypothetical protein
VTFVVICGGEFDQSIPNASTMCRLGWCRGFQQLGVPYLLVAAQDIGRVLPSVPNPICWISGSDYDYLGRKELDLLKRYRHAVLVSTAFQGEEKYFESHGFPNVSWNASLRKKILATEPAFLFTMSSEARFQFYSEWLKAGAKLASMPLACDPYLYEHPRSDVDYSHVEVAFVGGYWDYKARQFDKFLQPIAEKLHVYGYSAWPYGRYGGRLPLENEGALYRQASLSPVINEPHVSYMSVDINERVFKVLAAGGLAICDPTDGYRDWFSYEELLVPSNESEYWDVLHDVLRSPGRYQTYRQMGREAVLARHTYAHRARDFARGFEMDIFEHKWVGMPELPRSVDKRADGDYT